MKHTFSILLSATFLALLAAGCASNPDRVRKEMTDYTKQGLYDKARHVSVKHNPGGIPETDEERLRSDLIRTMVNPAEIRAVKGQISSAVNAALAKRDFDAARDAIWTKGLGLEPNVAAEVDPFKAELLREKVNIQQYVYVTNRLSTAVYAAIVKNDFEGARRMIKSIRPVIRVWSGDVEKALGDIRDRLVRENAPREEADKVVEVARASLAKAFLDSELRRDRRSAGDDYKPDADAFKRILATFRDALKKQGCPEERRNELSKVVADAADPVFRALWRPADDVEDPNPRALGTSRLNELIDEACRALCEDVIAPAQIAFRARELRNKVQPLLDAGDLDAARTVLYEYGVTAHPEVDDPVFAVKLALLNARVNPATLVARSAQLSKAVDDALAAGDFPAASDAIAAVEPVPTYSSHVDAALSKAASKAVPLGVPESGAAEAVAHAQEALYDILAPRPDATHDRRVLVAYARELAAMEEPREELDWDAVRKALENAAGWLVADDMPADEAKQLMGQVLAAFQALAGAPSAKVETLTTAELNRKLDSLKAELSAKVSAAIAAKMAAEAAAAAAKKAAEAEKMAAEAAAEAEKMRAMALAMAARAAAAVDFDARIAAFIEAVGDRVEPDVNRVLGDGARVLRLRRAGAQIAPADATSLLVAAVYMGFDDVMNLALTLGADIDAPSPKDELQRPAFLLALQYGWRGQAATVLAKADRTVRDARGQGAVHYAVRGGNGSALMELLRANVDTRTPDADGVAPLELAADLGFIGLVQALLPFTDPAAADNEGFTALLRAAQNGRLDIVGVLFAADPALLDAKTNEGDGALELAAKANAPDLLAWLLDDRQVAPTARVVSQLVIAGNVPTLQTMVAHGGRLRDEHLAAAVKLGDFPMVKYLVNCGMDVNAESVLKVSRGVHDTGKNDGTYYGPDGGTISDFLREQGQRL